MNTDPTGHVPTDDGDKQKKPPCAKKPTSTAKQLMDSTAGGTESAMQAYTAAQIGVQNPYFPRVGASIWVAKLKNIIMDGGDKYASEGFAKVTDAEMETAYGVPINGGNNGYGLGLPDLDQNTPSSALTAMTTRIQLRLNKCDDTRFGCTVTDEFIGAALGGDNAIAPSDLANLGNNVYGKPNGKGILPWDKYLSNPALENPEHNRKVIQQFVDNVTYLADQGAPIPDVDWNYICDLVKE